MSTRGIAKLRAELFEQQRSLCIYCERLTWLNDGNSRTEKMERLGFVIGVPGYRRKFLGRLATFDHIIPVSQGGTLHDGGVMACQWCNSLRATQDPLEFKAFVMQQLALGLWE